MRFPGPIAYKSEGEVEKSILHLQGLLGHQAQLAKAVQPGQRPLHHPAIHPQPTAVFTVPLGQFRLDAAFPQRLAVRLRILYPASIQLVGQTPGLSAWVQRPTTAHQRQQFLDLGDVGRRGIAAQRDAVGIN